MAKFRSGNLHLRDNQKAIFGDGDDSQLWFDGSELRLSTVISGVNPTQSYHLTTRWYVDDEINTHNHDHGALTGIGDDDHPHYSLSSGLRAFTGTVSGVTPTDPAHLVTKNYVDSLAFGLDWQDSVIDIVNDAPGSPSTGDRYLVGTSASGTFVGHDDDIAEYNGSMWVFLDENEGMATWVEDEDLVYVYNGTTWVKFGSTTNHNNLAGLQGGSVGQYYHLTSAQHTALTDVGGVANASSQHIHDDRYYTETEVDTISGTLQTQIDGKANVSHTHSSSEITDFVEATQDAVASGIVGAGTVTVIYDDVANTITISGSTTSGTGTSDHGALTGLGDDDHTQYIKANGDRPFTSTVSGITPTVDAHLATKGYVDGVESLHKSGRVSLSLNDSSKSVAFGAAYGDTNYSISIALSTTDATPSIYSYVVNNKAVGGFDVIFSGDIDTVNYTLEWIAKHD